LFPDLAERAETSRFAKWRDHCSTSNVREARYRRRRERACPREPMIRLLTPSTKSAQKRPPSKLHCSGSKLNKRGEPFMTKHNSTFFNPSFLLLAVIAAGCASPLEGGLNGTYTGTETGTEGTTQVSQNLNVTMSQDDEGNITGSWTDGSSSGSISGTSSNGSAISPMTVTLNAGTCMGTLSGSAALSNGTLGGTVSGTANCGAVTLNFNVTNQATQNTNTSSY
jgi:hypothetical protein